MGEKIRDIKQIKIGNSSLMVELNEGYTATQGRLIHIQNEKFRYLLTEQDFYHLSSMFMRAWSEFDYLKKQEVTCKKEGDFNLKRFNDIKLNSILQEITEHFNKRSINYRLLDSNNDTISFLVNVKHLQLLENTMNDLHFKRVDHPLGSKRGYIFLYQMHPFQMFQSKGINIEIFCELPCRSITAKTWIPLDRAIQREAWGNPEESNGILWCESKSRYIYILSRAIFLDSGFSSHTKGELSKMTLVLSGNSFRYLLSTVYFKYTDSLIEKLSNQDYDSIISDYYHFVKY